MLDWVLKLILKTDGLWAHDFKGYDNNPVQEDEMGQRQVSPPGAHCPRSRLPQGLCPPARRVASSGSRRTVPGLKNPAVSGSRKQSGTSKFL